MMSQDPGSKKESKSFQKTDTLILANGPSHEASPRKQSESSAAGIACRQGDKGGTSNSQMTLDGMVISAKKEANAETKDQPKPGKKTQKAAVKSKPKEKKEKPARKQKSSKIVAK